jgi:endonuclease/exonuclease/phosphatase family metal-dependent hydrolase
MKYLPVLLLMILSGAGSLQSQTAASNGSSAYMTWNIRYNNPGDGINAWPNRKDRVIAFLKEINPQVIGMQEVLAGQLNDITSALPEYSWAGAGRDDGKKEGEYVPILYQTSRFSLLRGDHFWLSETPSMPGRLGWDAACARMVTWINLIDRSTGDTLFVFNTHFDHMGVKARMESARLLVRAVDSLAGKHAAIVTGDFNATTSDTPHQVITAAGFLDSRMVSKTSPAGPEYTFSGFDASKRPGQRIDFIYLKNTKPVQSYIVRDDSFNGFYLSDHLPVMIRF